LASCTQAFFSLSFNNPAIRETSCQTSPPEDTRGLPLIRYFLPLVDKASVFSTSVGLYLVSLVCFTAQTLRLTAFSKNYSALTNFFRFFTPLEKITFA
jgi:hypothetical protein